MSLSSASTIAEIFTALDDAIDYDITNDAEKARTVVIASRMLVTRMPAQSGKGTEQMSYNIQEIKDMGNAAKNWIEQYAPDSLTSRSMSRGLSMRNFPS